MVIGYTLKLNLFIIISIILILSCQQPRLNHSLYFERDTTSVIKGGITSSPSASWIDYDGDGDEDLFVLNGFGTLEEELTPQRNDLFQNDGKGNFKVIENHVLVDHVTFSGSSAWGDYDNDGDIDLFIANQKNAKNELYQNLGNGVFTQINNGIITKDQGQSFSAIWVDVDNDGWLDLHVLNGRGNPEGQRDFLYYNQKNGKFKKMEHVQVVADTFPSGGAAWGDYDDDGDMDVVVPVNGASPSVVYRNEGAWNFTRMNEKLQLKDDPIPYSPRTSVAHWIDYDNDLDLDLFIGNVGAIDYLFQNDGKGQFERVTAGRLGLDVTYVSDVVWEDFDNDADLDYIIAVWGGASEYYENNGKGEFYPRIPGDLGKFINFASSISSNDTDNDGDLDVYLTHWPINEAGGEHNQYYINKGNNNNWLKLRLKGTTSNADGIGAKIIVTIEVDGEKINQLRYVKSRTSWRSFNGFTQHFGLGKASKAIKIVVKWPSGNTDVIDDVIKSNQLIEIKENVGVVN